MKRSAPSPIRLMLHAVDGVIPYMTPLLLQKHFPPSDHFVLGIAVQDTCIHPVYPALPNDDGEGGINHEKKKPSKPCGHTFSSTPMDDYLLGYRTHVVPYFDLYQNASSHSNTTTPTCTDKQVLVWTPQGRHGLTSDLYRDSTGGFQDSVTITSLYDMALDKDSTRKRQTAAVKRNQAWLQHCLQHSQHKVWPPVLMCVHDEMKEQQIPTDASISGIALIGYPHVEDRLEGKRRLETILKAYQQQGDVAVLATNSFLQILDAVRLGVNVIGTDLPTRWARSKHAFGCNLVHGVDVAVPLDENGCMDMSDAAFARDARPLVVNCQCLACREEKHSRAYIHHLVRAKELLAEILLFGHNLHQLLLLCREASNASQQGQLDEFCDLIEKQICTQVK